MQENSDDERIEDEVYEQALRIWGGPRAAVTVTNWWPIWFRSYSLCSNLTK